MTLRSNNLIFSGHIGFYIDITVNGVTKKYLVKRAQPSDSFEGLSDIEDLDTSFAIVGRSLLQEC